jgi:hypothetical protein
MNVMTTMTHYFVWMVEVQCLPFNILSNDMIGLPIKYTAPASKQSKYLLYISF